MKQASSPAWSIEDVPLQAREQVSAAATKEGISIGDWLTRNILDDAQRSHPETFSQSSRAFASLSATPAVSGSSPAPNANRRRVEEALQALAHVLESHERAQQHASEAMQSVASEVAAATREQAAVLQNLGSRVELVERNSGDLARRNKETADRLSALAADLEALGNKIVSAREASDRFGLFVQEQLSVFAERVRASEAGAANIARIDSEVARLNEIRSALSDRLSELAGKYERLAGDLHAAREISDRVSAAIQDKVAGLNRRLQDTEAQLPKIPELDRAVVMLGEGHALVAGQMNGLLGDLAQLHEQIAQAKSESARVEASIREELAALSSRVAATEEKVAKQAEIERTLAVLNTQDNAIASKIGALSGTVVRLQDEVQSARDAAATVAREQESVAVAVAHAARHVNLIDERVSTLENGAGSVQAGLATVQQSMAAFETRMQTAEAHIAKQGEIEDALSNFSARHEELAAQAGQTGASIEQLQAELEAVREASNRVAAVIQEKLSALAEHLDSSEERAAIFAQIENVAAALRDRVNTIEETAHRAAERNTASIGQSREAIGILIERSEAQATELREMREDLSRIEQNLAQFQRTGHDAMPVDNAAAANRPVEFPAESSESDSVVLSEPVALPPQVIDASAQSEEVDFAFDPIETEPVEAQPVYDVHAIDVAYSAGEEPAHETEPSDPAINANDAGDHADSDAFLSEASRAEIVPDAEQGTGQALVPVHWEQPEELPPPPEEPTKDILADFESEMPAAETGGEISSEMAAQPPAQTEDSPEGDYLSQARRIAREAHEQSAREGSLKGDWARSVAEETHKRYLRPALAGALVFAVGALAFWLARPAPTHMAGMPRMSAARHVSKSNLPHIKHGQIGFQQAPSSAPPASMAPAAPVPSQAAAGLGVPASEASSPAPMTIEGVKALAEKGDSKAMLTLGVAYDKGASVPVDQKESTAWLERAAEAGDAVAQFRLAVRLEKGVGAPKDPTQAVHWYRQAAAQGNRSAMYNLGVASANGAGTAKDLREAARWFQAAATLGLTDSQFNLAVLYEHGWGVQQSLVNAYQWYSIAALNGDAQSREHSEALATQITPAEKATADQAVAAFKAGAPKPDANDLPAILKSLAP